MLIEMHFQELKPWKHNMTISKPTLKKGMSLKYDEKRSTIDKPI
jgi:hypothetical protein